MKIKTAYSSLALACVTALGLSIASPAMAADGVIIGSVKDAAKARSYAGARIKLIELGLTTEAGRDGTFRFPSIPEGTYTLEISYLGEDTVTQTINVTDNGIARAAVEFGSGDTIDEILVRGQRSGQASAINQQRVSDRISSIVSADAIGQFPDQNAAESLQRLPGLSIERDQGEGRFVGIRGIDPNLNNVTINGLNIPSPESGVRSVALDVIPSELIQTLEVSKSVTPDMGGGAMLLVVGVLGALLEAQKSGKGQTVDAAMIDGTSQMMWMQHSLQASGLWDGSRRGVNLLDGGAPFYGTYQTKDGLYMALGAIEPQFYAQFLSVFGLDANALPDQYDKSAWQEMKRIIAAQFKTKTRAEWTEIFSGMDACVSPVLGMNEAESHPHNQSRQAFTQLDGFAQPAPAPRFSRTPSTAKHGAKEAGTDTQRILKAFGYNETDIQSLKSKGAI